jgi:hypothetical protein
VNAVDEPNEKNDASMPAVADRAPRAHVPPPSPALLAAIARGGPVATRRPVRTLAAVTGLSIVWAGTLLFLMGVRADLRGLPVLPMALDILVCLTGFVAELAFALVPSPRKVVPSGYDSAKYSLIVLVIVGPLALVVAASASSGLGSWPGDTSFWRSSLACAGNGLAVAGLPVLLGLHALRRVVPGGSWRTSLCVGAGAGILSGLTLQLHCSNHDVIHVALAHGSAILIPMGVLLLLVRLR